MDRFDRFQNKFQLPDWFGGDTPAQTEFDYPSMGGLLAEDIPQPELSKHIAAAGEAGAGRVLLGAAVAVATAGIAIELIRRKLR